MPRGPGKKENYNLDYSRFNSFDRDEDEQDDIKQPPRESEADAAGGPLPDMRDMLRSMPVELQEAYHLMSIAKANGDTKAQQRANELALKAVEKGGPEVRNTFMKHVGEQMPELAGRLHTDMDGGKDANQLLDGLQDEAVKHAMRKQMADDPMEDPSTRIDALRKEMEDGQAATRKEMERLETKQKQLERIKDPEDFFKFMEEEGLKQEDLQRIFSGDEEHMQSRFNEVLEKHDNKQQETASQDALKKVDQLHGTLFGTEETAPEPEPEEKKKPVRRPRSPPREPEPTIPMYRLQYTKDEAGKYNSVELKCNLPGVTDISSVNLDISDRHLRLTTMAPAPRYAVNAGPFPVLIDPSMAKAKYSKKREELSISVPAKLD